MLFITIHIYRDATITHIQNKAIHIYYRLMISGDVT